MFEQMSDDRTPDLDADTRRRLESVATATLSAILQKRGVRTTFLSGLAPIKPGQRMVGRARTLRFVPIREDLVETYAPRLNMQRAAIESLQRGEVLVIDARNDTEAGTIGDIFAARAIQLGAVGIVTDGAVRDAAALRGLDIAVYNRASHGATFRRMHASRPAGADARRRDGGARRRHRRRRDGVVVVPGLHWHTTSPPRPSNKRSRSSGAWSRAVAGESTDGAFSGSHRPDDRSSRRGQRRGGRGARRMTRRSKSDVTCRDDTATRFRRSAESAHSWCRASSSRDPQASTVPESIEAQPANLFQYVGVDVARGRRRLAARREDELLPAQPSTCARSSTIRGSRTSLIRRVAPRQRPHPGRRQHSLCDFIATSTIELIRRSRTRLWATPTPPRQDCAT
jgi:regulator of RNase E activity RraA